MTAWLSKDEAVDCFVFGGDTLTALIDMVALIDLVARALVLDGHLVTDEQVWREAVAPPMISSGAGAPGAEAVRYQSASVVFAHYAEWTANIGRLLGVDPDADIQPDWLAKNPCTQIIVQAMAKVAIDVLNVATDAYEAQHGHSMLDVFLASMDTGEDFEQSRVRLATQHSGLRAVK